MGKVELLILPRRDWIDTIRQASLRAFGQLSELRANFYQRQLQLASRPLPRPFQPCGRPQTGRCRRGARVSLPTSHPEPRLRGWGPSTGWAVPSEVPHWARGPAPTPDDPATCGLTRPVEKLPAAAAAAAVPHASSSSGPLLPPNGRDGNVQWGGEPRLPSCASSSGRGGVRLAKMSQEVKLVGFAGGRWPISPPPAQGAPASLQPHLRAQSYAQGAAPEAQQQQSAPLCCRRHHSSRPPMSRPVTAPIAAGPPPPLLPLGNDEERMGIIPTSYIAAKDPGTSASDEPLFPGIVRKVARSAPATARDGFVPSIQVRSSRLGRAPI